MTIRQWSGSARRTILGTALLALCLGGVAGTAVAAEGAGTYGVFGNPTAASPGGPYTPPGLAFGADHATTEATGHRHVDSGVLTPSGLPAAKGTASPSSAP